MGGSGQVPYGGSAWPLPGRIEAENYDRGGEGLAFHDTTAGNSGGEYRADDVDITDNSDGSGGYHLTHVRDGEWCEYTVDVASGVYDIQVRIATPYANKQIRVMLDDMLLGTVNLPKTGSWGSWQTVTLPDIAVPVGGEQILRLECVGGYFFLNWVEFVPVTDPYTAWAESFGLAGSNAVYSANPDGDEFENLAEFALGGNPTNGSDTGYIPSFGISAEGGTNGFEYIYARRREAAAFGLTYSLKSTTNLVSAVWTTNGIAEVGVGNVDEEFEVVTNSLPVLNAGYLRLDITVSE
jgi:hypothetical protein